MTVKRKLPKTMTTASSTAPGAGVKVTGNRMRDRADIRKKGGVLLPELKKVALAEFSDHSHSTDHIYPSEMARGDWCPRATYYRILTGKVLDETFSFVLQSIFDEGHSVEQKWQRRMRQTGKLWGTWKCLICKRLTGNVFEPAPTEGICVNVGVNHIWEYKEVALVNDALLIRGREDGGMAPNEPHDPWWLPSYPTGYLVEIKTIGPGTVRRDAPDLMARHYHKDIGVYDYDRIWKDLSRPFKSHVRQANVYLWLAQEMGLHFDTAQLLYEFKANQQTKEFTVKLSDRIIGPMLGRAQSIVHGLELHDPPPCPSDGCKACVPYEEALNGTAADDGGIVPEEGVPGGSGQAAEAGDNPGPVGGATGRKRATEYPTRPDGGTGPGTDDAVRGAEFVGQVPGRAASGSGGRRVRRRAHRDEG